MFSGFETIFSGIETSDSSIDARVFLVETTTLAIKAPFSDAEANVQASETRFLR
jgi:hypothetical protein